VRSIALANQKGGVGKTTTAIHMAHGLALAGKRVVLMDLDPQGNATVAVGAMQCDGKEDPLGDLQPLAARLWLVPSPGALGALPRGARVDINHLRALVAKVAERVDWLVIDCPPRMDDWGWAGIQLCDEVLVPVQAEFFAMHGLSQMLGSLADAAVEFPGRARLRGVLPTMVDHSQAVTDEVLQDLRRNLGNQVLRTAILRDSALIEAASFGVSIFDHSPASKGAFCYSELVKELIHG
jgi:chromosome partitioning protein